jgi:hypothetical protein
MGSKAHKVDLISLSPPVTRASAQTRTLSPRKLRNAALRRSAKKTLVNILGLSGLAHDSAAAPLYDDGSVSAMEESKLVRRRKAAGIPREAIRFCLEPTGTRLLERSGLSWRRRPAGDFSVLNTSQNRRRDAGATKSTRPKGN